MKQDSLYKEDIFFPVQIRQLLKPVKILLMLGVTVIFPSCQKGFLDTKPDISLSTVNTLEDCQLLLNNEGVFNRFSDPALGQISTDEFFSTAVVNLQPIEKNIYTFSKSIYPAGEAVSDWNTPYQQIYYANTVLDALDRMTIPVSQQGTYNEIKGTALFYRSWAFCNLLQTFAMPYDSTNAKLQLGIPIRLKADLNIKSVRQTEQECYNQILKDVELSIPMLPESQQYVTKPSKIAAYAFLARIYLSLDNFSKAYYFSNAALDINSELMDYNTVDTTSPYYFISDGNQYPLKEVIYHSTLIGYIGYTGMAVDSNLYNLYDGNDIRRAAYFGDYAGYKRFKGSYEFKNFGMLFSGLATDEMYLIRAECNARLGNTEAAMNDLNDLLEKRYITGTFTPRTAVDSEDALAQILIERRKELCFRGLRWLDLRRLNKDPRFATTVTHVADGKSYTLPPNDLRYAFPIPDQEIELSGIEQNPR